MKRIAVIVVLAYFCFLLENALYHAFGAWGKPELLILLVVFLNLYLGIRYSIIAALIAGLLKDSISIAPFGTYLFVYLAGAYVTTFVRWYFYQPGSRFLRALVAFAVVSACCLVQSAVTLMEHPLRWEEVVLSILIPQLATTMIAATFVFLRLRDVAVLFRLKN